MSAATTTVIFALTSSDANQFTTRLTTAFPSANLSADPSWSLSIDFYRSTSTPSAQPSSNSHLHLLEISTFPTRTFLCVSTEDGGTNVVAIPRNQTLDFGRLLVAKLGPLWQQMRQKDMHVSKGTCCEVGLFRIRIGELVRDRESAVSGVENRRILLAVSVLGHDDMAADSEEEKDLIREFCSSLELMDPGTNPKVIAESWGSFRSANAEASVWCEVLKKAVVGGGAPPPRVTEQ